MTGFDGRPFEFMGVPNTYYSIISERHHKVRRRMPLRDYLCWASQTIDASAQWIQKVNNT